MRRIFTISERRDFFRHQPCFWLHTRQHGNIFIVCLFRNPFPKPIFFPTRFAPESLLKNPKRKWKGFLYPEQKTGVGLHSANFSYWLIEFNTIDFSHANQVRKEDWNSHLCCEMVFRIYFKTSMRLFRLKVDFWQSIIWYLSWMVEIRWVQIGLTEETPEMFFQLAT